MLLGNYWMCVIDIPFAVQYLELRSDRLVWCSVWFFPSLSSSLTTYLPSPPKWYPSHTHTHTHIVHTRTHSVRLLLEYSPHV